MLTQYCKVVYYDRMSKIDHNPFIVSGTDRAVWLSWSVAVDSLFLSKWLWHTIEKVISHIIIVYVSSWLTTDFTLLIRSLKQHLTFCQKVFLCSTELQHNDQCNHTYRSGFQEMHGNWRLLSCIELWCFRQQSRWNVGLCWLWFWQ